MKISELITALEAIRAEEGDIEVHAHAYGDIELSPVQAPMVEHDVRDDTRFVMVAP